MEPMPSPGSLLMNMRPARLAAVPSGVLVVNAASAPTDSVFRLPLKLSAAPDKPCMHYRDPNRESLTPLSPQEALDIATKMVGLDGVIRDPVLLEQQTFIKEMPLVFVREHTFPHHRKHPPSLESREIHDTKGSFASLLRTQSGDERWLGFAAGRNLVGFKYSRTIKFPVLPDNELGPQQTTSLRLVAKYPFVVRHLLLAMMPHAQGTLHELAIRLSQEIIACQYPGLKGWLAVSLERELHSLFFNGTDFEEKPGRLTERPYIVSAINLMGPDENKSVLGNYAEENFGARLTFDAENNLSPLYTFPHDAFLTAAFFPPGISQSIASLYIAFDVHGSTIRLEFAPHPEAKDQSLELSGPARVLWDKSNPDWAGVR